MATEKNALVATPRTRKVIKLVPPDGGWGWMVLIGTAMSNVSIFVCHYVSSKTIACKLSVLRTTAIYVLSTKKTIFLDPLCND